MKKIIVFLFVLILLPTRTFCADTPEACGSTGVRVAIIDTGISTDFFDTERVLGGQNLVFREKDTQDRVGHGTEVAGILLGSDALGIKGIAPQAELVPLVWYDRYPSGVPKNGGPELLAEAIYAAVDQFGCRVLNISAGIPKAVPALLEAAAYAEQKGVVVVSAAGNGQLSADSRPYYPASADTVIGVGAADGKTAAAFSQHTGVDVLAPGVGLATVGADGRGAKAVSGTSFACAYVSGLCARLLAREPALTPPQVRQRIYAAAEDILEPGKDAASGWGLVSLESTLLPDVPAGAWYAESALWAVDNGLIRVSSSGFEPSCPFTRESAVTALWCLEDMPQTALPLPYSDVPGDASSASAIAWASEENIAQGTGSGHFDPSGGITREQFAVLLHRFCIYKGLCHAISDDFARFTDASEVSPWAADSIGWAVETGLLRGNSGSLFPGETVTRGMAAEILMRFCLLFQMPTA